MNDHSDDAEKDSPHDPTNNNPAAQQPTMPGESTKLDKTILHEHTPPMIIESGSLTVESAELDYKPEHGRPRPHVYKHLRGELYLVYLIAITEDGTVHPYGYPLDGPNWEVRIWLEEERGENYVLIQPSPQLSLYTNTIGGSGRSYLTLETDKKLTKIRNRDVGERPARYVYDQDSTSNAHYQIGKVEIAQNVSSGKEPMSPELPPGRKKVSIMPHFRSARQS